ncbi:plasmid mobilization protein [Limnofasciculus baicalensis]|uniref:MobC family plasmid mobilization relaxosome protein n=1 Tax=Limnofasciculus baicalensis BBK-W-15 TaxID=2699891 RepID=A0AAE3GQV7_9CYAN|nr:plasmid mobilization relaxosome protein MobC [Limnofasciculus baicalensis]MCP2728256.1 MobC family plasmid mobilization relaxosome protein [Limnofasciculus baicalensis BBK-W-15]
MARSKIRTIRHELKLTPEEKVRWGAKATSAGLSLNEIRRCVERRTITPIQPEVNRHTAIELGRIGVNLNQLLRAMNTAIASGQHIPNVSEAISVVSEVYKTVKKLQLELNGNKSVTDD